MPNRADLIALVKLAFDLVRELLLGSLRVFMFGTAALWRLPTRLNIAERVFLLLLAVSGLLLAGGWLGYTISFQAETPVYHTIMTDDFLWYFIFHGLAFLPVIIELLYPVCSSSEFRLAFGLRIAGLGGISILYLLTIADPQRISPTTEGAFTWNFYAFGLMNLAIWASGIRGMVLYAQKSHSD